MESKYCFSMELFADEFTDERHAHVHGNDSMAGMRYELRREKMEVTPKKIRLERVLALRLALNTGRYALSTSQLVECLMESMLRLK